MGYSIREKADIIATYRCVAVRLMETLAAWVPTTPALEAKALFGRHLWDFAQHADALGLRTAELRSPLHHNRTPTDGYASALEQLANITETQARIGTIYEVVLPDLGRRFRAYLEQADPLLDEPTIRLLERMTSDYERMRRQRDELVAERSDLAGEVTLDGKTISDRLAKIDDIVDYRAPAGSPV